MNWLNGRHPSDISWGKALLIVYAYLREGEEMMTSKGPPGREPEAVTFMTCSSTLHSCTRHHEFQTNPLHFISVPYICPHVTHVSF
jgi:hypothetical protein